jgi:Asp-tRNA(Asn)/Glu-tRNA(Gln) amidotransferase B subunit
VSAIVSDLALGRPPDAWQECVASSVAEAARRLYRPGTDRLFKFSMGLAMRELRGRVPAIEVADAVSTEIASR